MRATWHEPRDFQRNGRYKPEPFGSIRQVKYLLIELLLLVGRSSLLCHVDNYQRERNCLGGHSDTYKTARLVVVNQINAQEQ